MYRYYKFLVIPGLLVITACLFTGFGSANQEGLIKQLLDQRTSILQQAYFGQLDQGEAEALLAKVETQPLLSQDVNALRSSVPTDFQRVNSMEIRWLEKKVQMMSYLTYDATLRWYMNSPEGSTVETGEYQLVLKYGGDGYKLSEMRLDEEASPTL